MTANVAGFYGDDKPENRFSGPNGERYFTLVNKKTGEVELWNEEFGIDRRVGALDARTKNWNFDETASGKSTTARDFEVEYFSKPQNKAGVINQALTTVERDQQTGSNLEDGELILGNSTNGIAFSSIYLYFYTRIFFVIYKLFKSWYNKVSVVIFNPFIFYH